VRAFTNYKNPIQPRCSLRAMVLETVLIHSLISLIIDMLAGWLAGWLAGAILRLPPFHSAAPCCLAPLPPAPSAPTPTPPQSPLTPWLSLPPCPSFPSSPCPTMVLARDRVGRWRIRSWLAVMERFSIHVYYNTLGSCSLFAFETRHRICKYP
jgi:hypothetical protein